MSALSDLPEIDIEKIMKDMPPEAIAELMGEAEKGESDSDAVQVDLKNE